MPRAKRPLAEVDTNTRTKRVTRSASKALAALEKTAPGAAEVTNAGNKEDLQANTPVDPRSPKYLTLCWPLIDYETINGEDPRKVIHKNCKCKKPLSNTPEWPFFLSEGGIARMEKLLKEKRIRDQDANFSYVYKYFSSYGAAEAFDNYLKAFNQAFAKKDVSSAKMWEFAEVVRALDKAGIDVPITKELKTVDAKLLGEIRTEVAKKEEAGLYEKAAQQKD
ncbi:hypothetical protein F5884DRAFT_855915 [Xylogone sp. PMI_703]|nr:hypothetical protein F5884DRAFT_855915 [Xylogone sp. PMI_703]